MTKNEEKNQELDKKLDDYIFKTERRYLDKISPPIFSPVDIVSSYEFMRIEGMYQFREDSSPNELWDHMVDFITGASSLEDQDLIFLQLGKEDRIETFLGAKRLFPIKGLLKGFFPGIEIKDVAIHDLLPQLVESFRWKGMLSGIPYLPMEKPNASGEQNIARKGFHFERVVQGMRGNNWGYLVHANPRPNTEVHDEHDELIKRTQEVESDLRRQVSESYQTSDNISKNKSETVTRVMGTELVNKKAEYLNDLLEKQAKRIEDQRNIGRWDTAIHFGTSEEETTEQMGAILSGVLSCKEPSPDRLRIYKCSAISPTPEIQFHTTLSSRELASYTLFLQEEFPGFSLEKPIHLSRNFKTDIEGERLDLGNIYWGNQFTIQKFSIKINDLPRHIAVFGVTGSGKTTTIFNILAALSKPPFSKPFLVIEPAKTEYRGLLGELEAEPQNCPVAGLQIYTLGNDNVAPFRLNPFEFEIGLEIENLPVLSHIDFLKSVFNTAFVLYPPMPYVLEAALYEVYTDKGWDLASGTNIRLTQGNINRLDEFPIFPTLSNLYQKVEIVTKRLGYDSKIEQDTIAALKARIGSLRLGSKGLMLDTQRGIPMNELMSSPTILELEKIGNDDEKTFIIGILLTRIYEYWQSHENLHNDGDDDDLRHVLVIEEAHRLLKNTSLNSDSEVANLRSQAIETFVNMLSEVRHYGEAVCVAEQIPSKLTPDVIKNTNLKIIHRIVAKDDRELIAGAINLNLENVDYFSSLKRGQAIAYSEECDSPFHISLVNGKKKLGISKPTDRTLTDIYKTSRKLNKCLSVPDLDMFGIEANIHGLPDKSAMNLIQDFLNRSNSLIDFSKVIFRAINCPSNVSDAVDNLIHQFMIFSKVKVNEQDQVIRLLFVLGLAQTLQIRGADRNWSYSLVRDMHGFITRWLIDDQLSTSNIVNLDRFKSLYLQNTSQTFGYFPGCIYCNSKCNYLMDLNSLIEKPQIQEITSLLTKSTEWGMDLYKTLHSRTDQFVQRWLGNCDESVGKYPSYCASLILLSKTNMDEYIQLKMAEKLQMFY